MINLVAGGIGMIGSNVVRILSSQQETTYIADLNYEFTSWNGMRDLRKPQFCEYVVKGCDRVFHLADQTAGIGYAKSHHGQMLTDSLLVSLNLLESARQAEVKNYLYVSSSCVYADHYQNEAVPEYYADSYIPEMANEGYGWAKRIAEKQCRYYYLDYGMRTIIVRPANIYGPSYDWSRPLEDMHVVPALITKMLRGDKEITVWGTGKQRRMFMYEADAAQLMIEVMEKGHGGEAYNLGGQEISIRDLVDELRRICEYRGQILYDTSKPQGPDRKAQDTTKLKELGLTHVCNKFSEHLLETVEGAREAIRSH